MAKKPKVNKTQAVRDYLTDHPGAVSSEIAAALNKKGVKITASYVANIKTTLNKAGKKKKASKKSTVHVEAAPVAEKPATNGGTLTLEQVKKVAHTIKTLGGCQRVTEVLEVIKELGGIKKFRDLAEAMTVTETSMNDIPY